jgi:Ni/Fe-hydrogenase subunit HybB-like protein
MFAYFFLVITVFLHGKDWTYLFTPMGYWFLVEVLGFVLIPCFIFASAVRNSQMLRIRIAAILAVVGIILNRLNVSIIAFKWYSPERYFPSWMEIEITLAVIFAEILVFRWIVNRMPVFDEHPAWSRKKDTKDAGITLNKESKKWKVSTI